jgi:two-component system, OmpR family, sensor kinase
MARTVPSEATLLRRAQLVLALQSALAVAAILALVGVVTFGLVVRDQRRAADDALRRTAEHTDPDDLAAPPPGISLFVLSPDGAVLRASPAPPAGLPDRRGLGARPGTPMWTWLSSPTGRFRTLTVAVGDRKVQAALDLAAQAAERTRLLAAALTAGLVGMAGAAMVGWFVARRAMAPLGEALDRQSRFVADAAHELRTPLTLLSTRAQLLVRDADQAPPDQTRAEAAALAADAARLNDVVEDLLLSAQLHGGLDRRQPVELDQIAAEALATIRPHADQLKVRLTAELCPATVQGVPTALRRVVDALVDNAISYSPPGGQVAVRVRPAGPDVVLEVADQGAGLDQPTAGRLFERFAHGPQQQGRRARFGIGLALVREVVSAHGGQVEAATAGHGRGATFTVRLPRSQASTRQAPRTV